MYGGPPISAVAVLVYLLISQGPLCLLTGDEKKIATQLCSLATFQPFDTLEYMNQSITPTYIYCMSRRYFFGGKQLRVR
jgi:hypothetical protein